MLYPYDGVRSTMSEYREMLDYIKILKQEVELLQQENESLKNQLNQVQEKEKQQIKIKH